MSTDSSITLFLQTGLPLRPPEGYPFIDCYRAFFIRALREVGNTLDSSDESDEELVKRASKGDREAFQTLVYRHKDYIYSLVRRQVRDESIAEDLAQEIFIKVFRGLPNYRKEAQFKTWIIRIALNTTNSFFASRPFKQAKSTESLPNDTDSLPYFAYTPTSEADDRITLFHQAISRLSPKLRDVLVLCGLQDKSYQEAAVILAIPIGTIRSRLSAARHQMRVEITTLHTPDRGEHE